MGTGRHNYHKCCELAQNGKEISNNAIVVGVGLQLDAEFTLNCTD